MEVKGWGWPVNAAKAHYFVDSRSLCGRWLFFGKVEDSIEKSEDDCKTCWRKLDAGIS